MPMYNVLEYSSSYSDTTVSSLFYSKDKATTFNADIAYDNNDDDFRFFDFTANLVEDTAAATTSNNSNGVLKNEKLSCH